MVFIWPRVALFDIYAYYSKKYTQHLLGPYWDSETPTKDFEIMYWVHCGTQIATGPEI